MYVFIINLFYSHVCIYFKYNYDLYMSPAVSIMVKLDKGKN